MVGVILFFVIVGVVCFVFAPVVKDTNSREALEMTAFICLLMTIFFSVLAIPYYM